MQGNVVHEHYIKELDIKCEAYGFETWKSASLRKGKITRYIDLLASSNKLKLLLLIEVEMGSNNRAVNDIEKWRHLGQVYPGRSVVLWIVTPTVHISKLIQKRIKRSQSSIPKEVYIPTFFEALERLNRYFSD
ncbi:MAG: hypothetical protein COA78_16700 [Blastopirellula sp.]|nr:MAG: hypothetical protein COA78_16700 [Blastopirellula sp.]